MKYCLTNVHVIDGSLDGAIMKNTNIYIEEDKIKAITHEQLEGYKKIDCSGKYVTPGLINMHVHLFGSGKPSKILGGGGLQKLVIRICKTSLGGKILNRMLEENMKNQLYSGVTTVRGVGDFFYSDVQLKKRIEQGEILGPRLLVSGPAITVPGGHGDGTFALTADSEEELKKLVDENHRHGVDLIKICVTGGVMDAKVKGEPGELKMNLAQTKAVCDRAHELGYRVASHTESYEGIQVALEGGVDTIEHGAQLDETMIQQFHDQHSALICTLSPALPLATFSEDKTKLNELCVYNSKVVLQHMIEGVKCALDHHIPVGLGTDSSCPFSTQYDMYRELCYFKKYLGVSNQQAIHHATQVNAQIAHIDHITGSVEAKKAADLLILDKNPLGDLLAFKTISTVIIRGHMISNPKPKKNQAIDKELDTLL